MPLVTFRPFVGALAGLALCAAGIADAANLVANGDFETGDFSGWTQFGNTDPFYTGVDVLAPHDGLYAAYFGPGTATPGGIEQSIATVAGHAYQVSFWLQSEDDVLGSQPSNHFEFGWNGNAAPVVSLTDTGPGGYTQYSFTLQATSSSTQLRFAFGNDPAYWDLDGVAVTATAVPEPATWALMLGGLGALGLRRRARR